MNWNPNSPPSLHPQRKCPQQKTSHPRSHWTRKRGAWKPKKPYESENQALEFIRHHSLFENYRAYLCPVCGKWHIGYYKKS